MTNDAPLAGIRVVERTCGVGGAYAGRLLATLGADTMMIEPPAGHALRRTPPLLPSGQSSLFTYLAAGKRSMTLDVGDAVDRAVLERELARADVYIDDFPAEERDRVGLAPGAVAAAHPDAVVVSVRPFGMSGPKAGWAGEELSVFHASGEGNLLPNGLAQERHPHRPPLKIFGYFAHLQAGVAAAVGVLASMVREVGQVVDISVQDVVVALTAFGVQRYGDGSIEHRSTRSFRYGGVLECSDGYVELLTLEDRQWRGLVELMGAPDWAADPALADGVQRGLRGAEINTALRAWAHTQKASELVAAAQRLGVPAAKYASPADVLRDAHEIARGLFQSVEVQGIGSIPVLTAPFHIDGGPLRLRGGPPAVADRERPPVTSNVEAGR